MRIYSNALKANLSWFNTAMSSGIRVIEIPIIIYFINSEKKAFDNELDIFGILLSIIVASSGFLLPLATPASQGCLLKKSYYLVAFSMCCAFIFSSILLFIIVTYGYLQLTSQDLVVILILIAIANIAVGLRRWTQGVLIFNEVTEGALLASLFRIVFTFVFCTFLPKEDGTFIVALIIIVFASVVDTVTCLAYSKLRKTRTGQIETKATMKIFDFLSISLPSLLYTTQNFIIIFILSLMGFTSVEAWVIIFSYLSIYLGIYLDIESIFIRYSLNVKNSLLAVVVPLLSALSILACTLFYQKGKNSYFIDFQGLNNADIILTPLATGFIIIIVMLFLYKQALKGTVLRKGNEKVVGKSAMVSLLSIMVISSILLTIELEKNIVYIGCVLYFSSLLGETAYLQYKYVKYLYHQPINKAG